MVMCGGEKCVHPAHGAAVSYIVRKAEAVIIKSEENLPYKLLPYTV